jgi:hypothetical protein
MDLRTIDLLLKQSVIYFVQIKVSGMDALPMCFLPHATPDLSNRNDVVPNECFTREIKAG